MTRNRFFPGVATAALAIAALTITLAAQGQSGENPEAAQNWIARDVTAGLVDGVGEGGGLELNALRTPDEVATPAATLE